MYVEYATQTLEIKNPGRPQIFGIRYEGKNLLTNNEWGGFLRKQVPLCQYHHQMLHKGQLNHADKKRISEGKRGRLKYSDK